MENKPIFIQPGFLWDGNKHLSGKLELTLQALSFHLDDFKESNLNLDIPLQDIQEVQIFKLYEITSHGLIVLNKSGQINMFIMDDPSEIKKEIMNCLSLH